MLCRQGTVKVILWCLGILVLFSICFISLEYWESKETDLVPAARDVGYIMIPDFSSKQVVSYKSIQTTTKMQKQDQHYITLDFKGRLGNLLFQYASVLGIAKMNNLTALIPDNFELKRYFQITAKSKPSNGQSVQYPYLFEEKMACAYDPRTKHLPQNTNIKLKGYYQSWKYFKIIEPKIKQEFLFKDAILFQAQSEFQKLVKKRTENVTGEITFVAVHIRRGDMVYSQHFANYGYVSPGVAYLNKSMDTFRSNYSNCIFIVSSDDMGWCKQNMKDKDVVFMHPGHSAVIDMATLSQCNHTIMTVGSYGWWVAWFVNGETSYWSGYPRPGSKLAAETVREEYSLTNWVAIP